MKRRNQALAALEILKEYQPDRVFPEFGTDRFDQIAGQMIDAAHDAVLSDIQKMLDELVSLGFANKEIADGIGFDPAAVCRAHGATHLDRIPIDVGVLTYRKTNSLQMSLSMMRNLARALHMHVPKARLERLSKAAQKDVLTLIDTCHAGDITPAIEQEGKTVLMHNVFSVLSGSNDRKRLPVDAMLFSFGTPEHKIDILSWEGDSLEARKRRLHELKHIVEREEAEIASLEEKDGNKVKTRVRRSAFKKRILAR